MSIWKLHGGKKWDGQKFKQNDILWYKVENDIDREYHLSPEDIICGGLVDMHCHLWAKRIHQKMGVGVGMIVSSGVIACIDAGSFGYLEWPHADRYWQATSPIPTRSYLNIREEGLREWPCDKPMLPAEIPVDKVVEVAKAGKEKSRLLGLKVHLGWGKDKETDAGWLDVARAISQKSGLRVAVHITNSYLTIGEILSYLKPDDVIVHVYQGKGCAPLEEDGSYSQALIDAKARGFIMDGAVGMNHHSWKVFNAAQAKGFTADIVTTDCVGVSWQDGGPFKDLPHVISAFLNAGMPLDTVMKAVTTTPAKIMGIPYSPEESLLVLKRKEGPITYLDALGEALEGNFEYQANLFALNGVPVVCKL